MSLPMEWHVDHHSGDTIDKIEKGTGALYSFSEDSFEVIYSGVQLVASYGMLVYFSPSSAYIVVGMTLVMIWITVRFDKVLIGQYKELNHSENNVSESVFDAISNITTVIILRVERLVFRAILHKVEKPFDLFKRNNRLNELKWFYTDFCSNVMTVLVLGAYFWQNMGAEKGVLVGSAYLLISYLRKISNLFFKFTGMYGDILQRKAKVINSEELAEDFRTENFTNHILPKGWRRLNVSGLNFSYHGDLKSSDGKVDEGELHLVNVSLTIEHGERIAFVGETGSGKSTLLKVIRDLYHARDLCLSVDGTIIPNGFEGISQAISLVPQNPEIFATTIVDNITLGEEHSMDFIRHFTDMACFTDVAMKLPKQFNTSIKEKGVNLSGGEQQRLALSRGLLACHDKDIILLDEPTSSLDTETGIQVYQNILREFNGKTVISTVHSLHLLTLFDKIYFFNEGIIVGSGTLRELLDTCPVFSGMWQKSLLQSSIHGESVK